MIDIPTYKSIFCNLNSFQNFRYNSSFVFILLKCNVAFHYWWCNFERCNQPPVMIHFNGCIYYYYFTFSSFCYRCGENLLHYLNSSQNNNKNRPPTPLTTLRSYGIIFKCKIYVFIFCKRKTLQFVK